MTEAPKEHIPFLIGFQLTRSRGAWRWVRMWLSQHMRISTHTLTWSVTRKSDIFKQEIRFQLTRSRGAWLPIAYLKKSLSIFQLTRSRGAWQFQFLIGHERFNFNSHAHVERDTWCCVYLVLAQRDADLFFYLMGIGLILFTVRSQIAWHFHANLLGICGSLGVRWSKY